MSSKANDIYDHQGKVLELYALTFYEKDREILDQKSVVQDQLRKETRIEAISSLQQFCDLYDRQLKVVEGLFSSEEDIREFALKESVEMGLVSKKFLCEPYHPVLRFRDLPNVLKRIPEHYLSPELLDKVLKLLIEEHEKSHLFPEEWAEVLYELFPVNFFTRRIVNWIIGALTVEIHDDGLTQKACLERSDAAVVELCNFKSKITSNILHLLAQRRDISFYFQPTTDWDKPIEVKVNFQNQRILALKELEARGNPSYDLSAFWQYSFRPKNYFSLT